MQEFAIPFTGQYNTRISQSNSLASASGVIGIGVVGIFIIGAVAQSTDKDERYINCFMTEMGGRKYIMKRPGWGTLNTPSAGNPGNAILVWTGFGTGQSVITSFGAVNSTVYNGVASLGAITGRSRDITETFVSTTPTLVVPSGDSTAWYYDTGVAVMTKITNANYPGNAGKTTVGSFAHMDGYAFQMDSDGNLYNSDLNTVTGWSALGVIPCNAYPDKGIGCVRYKNYIMAFGTLSVQFFQNAGNPVGSPLNRVDNMTQKIGCIGSDSIALISDVVFWVGSSPEGGCTVYKYDGGVQRISTPEQDYQLLLAGPNNISITTLRIYGRSLALVKANTVTYTYIVEDKRWHEWSSANPLWYRCAGLSAGSQILNYAVSNVSTTGSVFIINPAALVFNDNGTTYSSTIQSANDDYGTSRIKAFNEFRVEADIEPLSSVLSVYFSDDDYMTFTLAGTIDLSAQSYLAGLGATRQECGNKRAWRMVHSSDAAFRIYKAGGMMTVGQR